MSISFEESKRLLSETPMLMSMSRSSTLPSWEISDIYPWFDDYYDDKISTIDENKNITVHKSQINIAQEANSQFIPFEMMRRYDNIDLMDMAISIHFTTSDKKHYASQPVNVEYDDEKIKFAWRVDENATHVAGPIKFEIHADGVIVDNNNKSYGYRWKSNPNNEFKISESICEDTDCINIETSDSWVVDIVEAVAASTADKIADAEIVKQVLDNYCTKEEIKDVTESFIEQKLDDMSVPDLDDYATKEYVDEAVESMQAVDLTDYALKSDIPNTDNFVNKEYVDGAVASIPKVDLTDYAKKSDIPNTDGFATKDYVNDAIPEVDLTDYAKKSDIPSTDGFVTEQYVNDAIAGVDLTGYALKSEIPSTSGLATEAYVDEKVASVPEVYLKDYAKTSDIPDVSGYALKNDIPDVTDYAKKSDIPSLNGYATIEYVDEAVSLASGGEVNLSNYYTKEETDALIPDTTGLATEQYVKDAIPDLSGYATTEYVGELWNGALDASAAHTALQLKNYVKTSDIPDVSDIATKQYVEAEIGKIDIPNPPDLSSYATIKYVDEAVVSASGGEVDLSNYYTKEETDALTTGLASEEYVRQAFDRSTDAFMSIFAYKTEIPKNVSQLTNDLDYITKDDAESTFLQWGDLNGYATKQYVNDEIGKIDITNSPDLSNYVTQEYVDNTFVSSALLEWTIGKAMHEHIPTNVSQLINDKNYATETYVDSKITEALSSSGGSEADSEYVELAYIENTGTQNINTGYIIQENDTLTFEYEIPESARSIAGDKTLFMGYIPNTSTNVRVGTYGANYKFYVRFGNTASQVTEDLDLASFMSGTMSLSKTSFSVNGVHLLTPTWKSALNDPYLYIPATNSYVRVKSFKVYNDSGELVKWYVPMLRRADEVAGLYEKVEDVFLTNTGIGMFLYPPLTSSGVGSGETVYAGTPTLTTSQTNAMKALMGDWYDNRDTFFYEYYHSLDAHAGTTCYDSSKKKFKLCCATFVQNIMMGRSVADYVGKTNSNYSANITKTAVSSFGYYFDFRYRRLLYGLTKKNASNETTGYYGFTRVNQNSDVGSYSLNTYYVDGNGSLYSQQFNNLNNANDMARELYELGCEIPFSELDVGDIWFTGDKHLSPNVSGYNAAAWRNITHVGMVYDVYEEDGHKVYEWIECTNAFGDDIAIEKSKITHADEFYKFMGYRVHANHVFCARLPVAFGVGVNVPSAISKTPTP